MATEQDRCPTKDYSELLQQRHESELRIVSKAWEDDAFKEKLLKLISWPRQSRFSRVVLLNSQTLSDEGGPYGCCEK
jgi:hypothetical protein